MMRSRILALGGTFAIAATAVGLMIDHLIDLVWARVFVVVLLEVVLLTFALVVRAEKSLPILCDPIVLFVAFQAQFFVIGPLCLPYTRTFAESPMTQQVVVSAVLAFVALLVMFFIGYHLPLGRTIAARLPSFERTARKFPGRWIENVLLALGLASCAAYVVYQGGFRTMLGRGYGTGVSAAFFTAPFLLLVLATFLMGWRVFSSPSRTRQDVVLFACLVLFEILFWGMLLGQRKWLFQLFFGLTAIFLLRRGSRAVPRFVLPTILVALIVYLSVWGSIRGRPLAQLMEDRPDPRYAQFEALHSGYLETVAGPFAAACLVLEIFPEREPYRYGQTLLVALLSPIPRSVWPDKPIGLGKELTWYLGSYYAASYDASKGLSITPTLVGDFYANLGIGGILIGGLAFGIAFRVVAAYAAHGMQGGIQRKAGRVLVPAVFLAGLVELRAETAMLTLFYMYTLVPLLVLLWLFSFETDPGLARRSEPGSLPAL